MEIKVITGSGIFEVKDVKGITIPTLDGERTLLNKHSDTMLALGFGKGFLKTEEGKQLFALSGGIASLESNVFTLIPEQFSFSIHSVHNIVDDSNYRGDTKFIKLLESINERD